ncbi:membrane protein insertion efficiency factor YidD [Mycobacterium sp. pUA109]|uniref:membrane protein insertion efficiency factor YidD n=1 Tax=Mycobacterium sp. pUA109 TaxID=3238982 RepID=UPI00351B9962
MRPAGALRQWRNVRALPVRGLLFVINLYRHLVSPLRLPSCRFIPTCSQYAVDALTEYGLLRGAWLSVLRLAKCGPWHRGGWDPIPERAGSCAHHHDVSEVWDPPAKRTESERLVL